MVASTLPSPSHTSTTRLQTSPFFGIRRVLLVLHPPNYYHFYVDTTSIKTLPPATIQMHYPPTNRINTPKKYQKNAPNAPELTGVFYLHPPASSNAIGVIKCSLFVSLIIQVSHCIFNVFNHVHNTHDSWFCSNSYPRTRPPE
jgi:hypothetical protein